MLVRRFASKNGIFAYALKKITCTKFETYIKMLVKIQK